jgi:phenylpropionate dioxygenase-like ring-hydroxylating dioxygenase large terminal subunit
MEDSIMEQTTKVEIIRELMRQLDEQVNVDAGVQYKNPTSAYTSQDLAKREWESFFRNHPQLIGLSGDLPKPGTYLTIDDFGVPLLATRDADGRFRAFVNACRHRGVRVAHEARGSGAKFTCPFHNWTYSNRGDLIAIPREQDFGPIEKSCYGLKELPAQEKYGQLWVYPQPDGALDVDELLGELAPEVAGWNFGHLQFVGESVLRNDLNWKLANDTFGETYHFPRLHKNTLANLFYGDALHYTEFDRNHRFVWATKGIDAIRNLPEESWDYDAATGMLYYLFPNIQLTASTHSCSLIKIYPDAENPGHSITRVGHYFSQEMIDHSKSSRNQISRDNVYDFDARTEDTGFSLEATMEIFDSTIEQEDYLMGETTQQAAESGLIEHVMFGRNEPALHHYHNTFRSALGMAPMEQAKT